MYSDHMSGWGWGMILFWTLLLILLAGAVIWLVANFARGGHLPTGGGSHRSAREILDERLALGEIDAGEYDRLREKLEPPATTPNLPAA